MNYQETYNAKLEAQKKAVLSSAITENIELAKLNDEKIEKLYEDMSAITGKPVYSDFSWRAGKIMGILRHIQQNPKKRKELLQLTGLSSAHIDMWWQVGGNLPYINTVSNTLNLGRPMDCNLAKELLKVVASELNILLDDVDIMDITESNWNRMYQKALEDAQKTIELNSETGNVTYEE